MLKDYASNAREYGHFSEYSALAWTASWGGSSGVAIDAASTLTGKSRGVAARLAEMGYLQPINGRNLITSNSITR